ncbi:pentapeptide repeat-containing protein [Streptomyces canus]|uniref:pentapeptide repeat-containing protein n=1 Tax=Streptomyces canus TaxID=58343 RepID=UPI0033FCB08C
MALTLFLALAFAAFLLVLRGPWWFDGEYIDRGELRSGSAALVTGLRTALIQLIAAAGAGIALLYTARNYRLTRRGQVTDRFTKALERLGSDEMYIRIGGVIALEQILQDAPEQSLHTAQVLGAFIRRRAPKARSINVELTTRVVNARKTAMRRPGASTGREQPLPLTPDEDVQAALTVLTRPDLRRRIGPAGADFSNLHLAGATFYESDLSYFNLSGATLSEARLRSAILVETNLDDADLSNSDISHANCTNARMNKANLSGSWVARANFTKAFMHHANLTECYILGGVFKNTRLQDSIFNAATIDEVDFTDTNLRGASFNGARFSDSVLDYAILEDADLTESHGITVEQAVKSIISEGTRLPIELQTDVAIRERQKNSPEPRWDV